MFIVKVIDRSTGKPIYNKNVRVIFSGVFSGCTKNQFNDKDGESHFSEDIGLGIIYKHVSEVFERRIEGQKMIHI